MHLKAKLESKLGHVFTGETDFKSAPAQAKDGLS